MTKEVYCLMGPTASGKTALALSLACRLPMEIISVDSALIYRGMDIGTAKPNIEEQRQVSHHLLDIIDPNAHYSVGQFCQDATKAIHDIQAQGKIPLLAGGTMMYFKALQEGLARLPAADADIRAQLLREGQANGWPALHARLQRIDPITAARLKPQDQQRIQRALEVYMLSGQPLSQLLEQPHSPSSMCYKNILLLPENRAWLHERIARRFARMLEAGFLQEVADILKQWPDAVDKPAFRMVGYRQALDFLQHGDVQLFTEKAIAATRQLAKRQLTWIRHWPTGFFLDPQTDNLEEQVFKSIKI